MSVTTDNNQLDLSGGGPSEKGVGNGLEPTKPTEADSKRIEKSISCTSCRKRKLKCDRTKPRCGTCTRLHHECEYPERRRNPILKRRNMKELEARLAQVETQLVSESNKTVGQPEVTDGPGIDWNNLEMDINLELADEGLFEPTFDIPTSGYNFQASGPSTSAPEKHGGNLYSQELISLGLQEPLPSQEMMNDLYEIYFRSCQHTMPMIHKLRFLASLNRAPHMAPPICLRYAMWSMAATSSDKYAHFEEIFYERARRYMEATEMKGRGADFVSLYHAQTWQIISTYEAIKTLFSRSWVSVGRTARMCQMLGLQRLDGERTGAKEILLPAKDWIELEERRRTFWAAFYSDRWASAGTGWPMIIDEKDISTNLPASDESFENGIPEPTVSLTHALTAEGASKIWPFAGIIVSAALFGRNYDHLHRKGFNDHPEDLANGLFWKRHRAMDNVLSNTFLFLPRHLRLPDNIRDQNVAFLHMNIHGSVVCLHQAAVITAKKNNLGEAFVQQNRARSLIAAEEISNIMRLISHMNIPTMNGWMGFCLYIASGVFIQDHKTDHPRPNTISNLEFLLSALRAFGLKHTIAKHFAVQLELDMLVAGIGVGQTMSDIVEYESPCGPGMGMADNNFRFHASYTDVSHIGESNSTDRGRGANDRSEANSTLRVASMGTGSVIPPYLRELREEALPEIVQNHNGNVSGASNDQEHAPLVFSFPLSGGVNTSGMPAVEQISTTENTPSSDSSTSNTAQYPFRPMDASNEVQSTYGVYQSGPHAFQPPDSWNAPDNSVTESTAQPGDNLQEFLQGGLWNPSPLQN